MRVAHPAFIKMSKKEFISEHKSLVKILKNKNKLQQLKEARKQAQELKKLLYK